MLAKISQLYPHVVFSLLVKYLCSILLFATAIAAESITAAAAVSNATITAMMMTISFRLVLVMI